MTTKLVIFRKNGESTDTSYLRLHVRRVTVGRSAEGNKATGYTPATP
ncbi:MAG TPA: hypothetical protein VJS64_05415 [Pyrinomonadaceae bacterium]|nr:hypothetical protein [Pyrinomonadaceae bacterium]